MYILSKVVCDHLHGFENAANTCLCYLLDNYEQARIALKQTLKLKAAPTRYETEVATDLNCRPDITGFNEKGDKVILIEGKFGAHLTENQPVNYLKELNAEGKLLFVVPEQRVDEIQSEIIKRLSGRKDKRISITTWLEFLQEIENQNSKNHNKALESDLHQIKNLCERGSEGIATSRQSDLSLEIRERFDYYVGLLKKPKEPLSIKEPLFIKEELKEWDKTDFKGLRESAGNLFKGFFFRAFQFGCYLAVAIDDWFSKSDTPYWLYIAKYVTPQKFTKLHPDVYKWLNEYDSENSYDEQKTYESSFGKCADTKRYISYAIILKAGMDESEIRDHVVNKTKDVLTYLHEKDIKSTTK